VRPHDDHIGVDFVGGYTAMIQKGKTAIDRAMIEAMPRVLAATRRVCASVVLASTKAGINMDGCYTMSRVMKEAAGLTADEDGIACAKLVLFANPVEDNPFMAGAYFGPGESDSALLVGVSGPGAIRRAHSAASITNVPEPHMKSASGERWSQPVSRRMPAASTSLMGASPVSAR